MNRLILAVLAAGMVGSGCASVATNRYLQADNPVRIEALQAGGEVNGALVGLDVFALEQVAAHPWLTTGAALVDAAMVYGVYALGEDQEWWGSDGGGGGGEGNRGGDQFRDGNSGAQTSVAITGDGNTVIVQNTQPGGSNTGGQQPITAPGSGSNSEYKLGGGAEAE